MEGYRMIKEVIFDIDDTLYDYEAGHAQGMKKMGGMRRRAGRRRRRVSGGLSETQGDYKRLGRDDAAIHSRSIRLQNLLEQCKSRCFRI